MIYEIEVIEILKKKVEVEGNSKVEVSSKIEDLYIINEDSDNRYEVRCR